MTCCCTEMTGGRVVAWTERGNSVLHELTCSQLAENVRSHNVHLQQPFDVTGTWISTRQHYLILIPKTHALKSGSRTGFLEHVSCYLDRCFRVPLVGSNRHSNRFGVQPPLDCACRPICKCNVNREKQLYKLYKQKTQAWACTKLNHILLMQLWIFTARCLRRRGIGYCDRSLPFYPSVIRHIRVICD